MIVGAFTVHVYDCVPLFVLLSVAVTVIAKLPPAVGVPASSPPVVRVTPAGSVPDVTA